MQKILVNLKSIKQILAEIEKDNMEFIEFNIVPEQIDNRYIHPAFLHVDGISKDGMRKDYESIDALSMQERKPNSFKPVLLPVISNVG